MKRSLIIATIVVTAWTLNSIAQDNEMQGPPMHQPGMNQGGSGGKGGMPAPGFAVLKALDKNGDKVIDEKEIANASTALRTLDRNEDGKVTPNEIMQTRPRSDGEQSQGNREGRGNRGGQNEMMGPGNEKGDCENCGKRQCDRNRMGNRGEQSGPKKMGNRQSRGGEGRMGRGGEEMGPQQGGPGREGGMRPPIPPFIQALDPNGDKVVDADEIANIQKAIKKLDKNGDGKLTIDELLPRPPRMEGEQGGPEGRGNRGGEGRGRGGDRQGPPPQDDRI